NLYFVKSATSGQCEAYAGPAGKTPTNHGSVKFTTAGTITGTSTPAGVPTTNVAQFSLSIPTTTGAANPQNLKHDLTGTT
ncbi:flagellar hook protein FlgE, partial [Burkholderia pseudomallei]